MSGTGLLVHPDITPDEVLAHYGVPGMRWGVTTKSDSGSSSSPTTTSQRKGLTDGQKKALKIGAGVVAVAGAAVVVTILAKNGKLPVSSLSRPKMNPALAKAVADKKKIDAARKAIAKQNIKNVLKARKTGEVPKITSLVNNPNPQMPPSAISRLAGKAKEQATVKTAESINSAYSRVTPKSRTKSPFDSLIKDALGKSLDELQRDIAEARRQQNLT